MRIVHAAGIALALAALFAGQVQAAGMKHWSSRTLQLGLTYPGAWRIVAERGATLKLLAPDAAGEFELFALPAPLSPAALAARADATLSTLHCAGAIRHTSGPVGHLAVTARIATGACSGGDLGWKLTVSTFNYGPGAVLLRSWLFHAQPGDGAALAAITTSLGAAGSA